MMFLIGQQQHTPSDSQRSAPVTMPGQGGCYSLFGCFCPFLPIIQSQLDENVFTQLSFLATELRPSAVLDRRKLVKVADLETDTLVAELNGSTFVPQTAF